ncbi:MAG TPA: TetR/AcrR family transcriptional regulator [Acidothermaceae bacterium]|jgi:AcrR family transcriptional regulator
MADPVLPAIPADAVLPASIELAWGLRDRSGKGPKRALTLERIVAAGIAVAGLEGLGAVSMARVAAEVGSSTMALYRYLPSKDDLLELMVDSGLGRPPAVFKNVRWRKGLRLWAEGIRDAYRAHPWALRVPISGPPLGPNNLRWFEAALSCLRNTSLTEQQKVSVVLLVSGFVRNEETLTMDIVAKIVASGQPPENYGRQLARLVDQAHFPSLYSAVVSGALEDENFEDPGLDAEFEFGLERILDGIAVLIDKQRLAST